MKTFTSGLRTRRNSGSRLLAVGPLPPPPDGPSVSFALFCKLVGSEEDISLTIVDSSPRRLKEENRRFAVADFFQAIRTIFPFAFKLLAADCVLVFGSNGFLLRMAPLLVGMAKLARKRCFVRVFGGSLDLYFDELPLPARRVLLWSLRIADGVIVQTKLLRDHFAVLLPTVEVETGYRIVPEDLAREDSRKAPTDSLKLVFVGHVNDSKGIFVLLESLRRIRSRSRLVVECDIFGPGYESAKARFENELKREAVAVYRGVLEPEEVIPTLSRYDVLVFPTFYRGEGHPGVLIEAMMAGLPVITTSHRAIPELIQDGVNGLLVSPQDPEDLAQAIERIFLDSELYEAMAKRSGEKGREYDASEVVPRMLRTIRAE